MKNQRIVNIRAFAILIVVLGHSIILYSDSWNIFETTYRVPVLSILKDIINIIQMPLFFSLSGFLFFYSSQKKKSVSCFIKNKIIRLIVPYMCTAFLYMVPLRLLIDYSHYERLTVPDIVKQILLGYNNGHLWYLYALFIIFIIMYFLDIVLKWIENNVVYIIVFFIMTVLSLNVNNWGLGFINDAIRYLMWFYMGYMLNKYEHKQKDIAKNPIMLMAVLFVIMWLFTRNSVLEVIASLMSVLLIYRTFPQKSSKIVDIISENSFGIYLFHSPLIYITYTYIPNAMPVWVVLLNFVVFGLIAFGMSYYIKKTRFKFMIGD